MDGVLALETSLYDRSAVLEEAASQPRASAYTIVEAILKDKPSEGAEELERPSASEETGCLSRSSMEAALIRPAFREVAKSLQEIGSDSIRSLAAGFDGRCPLAVSALCSKRVVGKHPVLLALYDLRPYIPEYLSWALTANSAGVVPARLARYSVVGPLTPAGTPPFGGTKFVEQLLAFEFAEVDWVNSPGGLSEWYKARRGVAFAGSSGVNPLAAWNSQTPWCRTS